MHRIRITFCALILFTSGVARDGIGNAGTTAGNFLSVGSGASILSMGGATLGSGRDLHAAAWNPAALGYLGETQLSLGHSSLAMEASQEWLAFGGRLSNDATRWAVDALYQSEGGFDGRDALNQSTGSFNVSNMALGLRVARPFGDRVSAGFGVRWVNENLGDAMALDELILRLEKEDAQAASVVRLRFYAGLGVDQAAEVLGVSPRTVKRDWAFARAWLLKEWDSSAPTGG